MKENNSFLNEIVEIEILENKVAPSGQWDPID